LIDSLIEEPRHKTGVKNLTQSIFKLILDGAVETREKVLKILAKIRVYCGAGGFG